MKAHELLTTDRNGGAYSSLEVDASPGARVGDERTQLASALGIDPGQVAHHRGTVVRQGHGGDREVVRNASLEEAGHAPVNEAHPVAFLRDRKRRRKTCGVLKGGRGSASLCAYQILRKALRLGS